MNIVNHLYLSVKQNNKYNVSVQIMHLLEINFELHNRRDKTFINKRILEHFKCQVKTPPKRFHDKNISFLIGSC